MFAYRCYLSGYRCWWYYYHYRRSSLQYSIAVTSLVTCHFQPQYPIVTRCTRYRLALCSTYYHTVKWCYRVACRCIATRCTISYCYFIVTWCSKVYRYRIDTCRKGMCAWRCYSGGYINIVSCIIASCYGKAYALIAATSYLYQLSRTDISNAF